MKFDVFISFRGIDTRRTFVSHLLLSLFRKRITTFKHEEEMPGNQPPSSNVLQAIEESEIAIAVISQNYATSVYCLDELAKIIECKEKGSLVVVPVFYEADPSDVIKQVDDLGDHGDGDNHLEKVKRWRDALAKSIHIYEQDYSYWDDGDSYSFILDRVMVYVTQCLSATKQSELESLCKSDKVGRADSLKGAVASEESAGLSESYEKCIAVHALLRIDSIRGSVFSRQSGDLSEPDDESLADESLGERCAYSEPDYESGLANESLDESAYLEDSTARIRRRSAKIRRRSARIRRRSARMDDDIYVTGKYLSRFVISNDSNSFVGMDRLMNALKALLDLKSRNGILEIGIWGVMGVGKSTLVKCVYEEISPQFQDHHYFLKDTTNCSVGSCLLEDVARAAVMTESESLEEVVKAKLGHRKVLLIVDDLYNIHHLENIRKSARWFGPGSRLIFVTQYKDLLLHCGVERRYEVDSLRYDEALQLFSQFAFKQEHVPREYHRLSVRAVLYTGRIPLALKVFGSFLRGKFINEWERELCRLEASQDHFVAKVSSYIGDAFS